MKIALVLALLASTAAAAPKKPTADDEAYRAVVADFRAIQSALKVGINCNEFRTRIVDLSIKIDALLTDTLSAAERAYNAKTQVVWLRVSLVTCPTVDMEKIDIAVDKVVNWKATPAERPKK